MLVRLHANYATSIGATFFMEYNWLSHIKVVTQVSNTGISTIIRRTDNQITEVEIVKNLLAVKKIGGRYKADMSFMK